MVSSKGGFCSSDPGLQTRVQWNFMGTVLTAFEPTLVTGRAEYPLEFLYVDKPQNHCPASQQFSSPAYVFGPAAVLRHNVSLGAVVAKGGLDLALAAVSATPNVTGFCAWPKVYP